MYLINYSNKNIHIISLVITIIIFTLLQIFSYRVRTVFFNANKEKSNSKTIEIYEEIKPMELKETKENSIDENTWQIEIPKINLIAPIHEGTSQDVMLEYVGHFEDTEFLYGNVGLAAHNRGFPINYFARIKDLEIGDKIFYKTNFGEKTYEVISMQIILDTDWSYLGDTDKNTLTLITCVANRPEKRLCIQATEVKQ